MEEQIVVKGKTFYVLSLGMEREYFNKYNNFHSKQSLELTNEEQQELIEGIIYLQFENTGMDFQEFKDEVLEDQYGVSSIEELVKKTNLKVSEGNIYHIDTIFNNDREYIIVKSGEEKYKEENSPYFCYKEFYLKREYSLYDPSGETLHKVYCSLNDLCKMGYVDYNGVCGEEKEIFKQGFVWIPEEEEEGYVFSSILTWENIGKNYQDHIYEFTIINNGDTFLQDLGGNEITNDLLRGIEEFAISKAYLEE